ncbi:MAG: ATP-binding protein [Gemmataceae bacterium]|nr:ATP-binding protein [Gemmataceae bacterium]MCS7269672.1 ATP-binding protein [Gemmataceae bacterium]MDW8243434.1 ATP-binding protein [Thermogemmata sp.]
MRFIIAPEFYEQMKQIPDHPVDCYVRPGEYLHHLYIDGVKYVIAPAVYDCLREAEAKGDTEAIAHLRLHWRHYEALRAEAEQLGVLSEDVTLLGDPPPGDQEALPSPGNAFVPPVPGRWEDLGLELPLLYDLILRTLFMRGQLSGGELARTLALPFGVLNPLLQNMRRQGLIDIVAQHGHAGDAGFVYAIKPPKGNDAVAVAMEKTTYVGPAPVPYADYVEIVLAQSIRRLVVTRRTIREAFHDLVLAEDLLNQIGPAINSAQSIFFFGYPGNGKSSIAERITRLMHDTIYIPHAVEVQGQIIRLYDPILHRQPQTPAGEAAPDSERLLPTAALADPRFVRIQRPTIIVGGELTLDMLDLRYNVTAKVYEAPLQMKANGGVFMIDDFGRQQVRPMDLLNRWIIPLEKHYDYLTTSNGNKIEVPFDQLLIFSTNLDPHQLADEAFLRRIKFKIEVRNPDEQQYRQVWQLVCQMRRIPYDAEGIDYLINKWYRPYHRPFRMCQPRDLLEQMIAIAKYNMERVNFSPDLIDAACATYFVSQEKKDFGAQVRLS